MGALGTAARAVSGVAAPRSSVSVIMVRDRAHVLIDPVQVVITRSAFYVAGHKTKGRVLKLPAHLFPEVRSSFNIGSIPVHSFPDKSCISLACITIVLLPIPIAKERMEVYRLEKTSDLHDG